MDDGPIPTTTSDAVANFQLDGQPVRGRICRLGEATISPILHRHAYPPAVAALLGQAMALAALVGSSLKFNGRLLVQAEGDGPVTLLVAEFRTSGELRGYARVDSEQWQQLETELREGEPSVAQVIGQGSLALMIIHDDVRTAPYQGVVPLERDTLAECAEEYFLQSEQVPTKVSLAVAEVVVPGKEPSWHAGGLLLQRIARDDERGDTEDAWAHASAVLSTLSSAELADPELDSHTLLYRLFHETGVRVSETLEVRDQCNCDAERLRVVLRSLSDEELREMCEEDGAVAATCQFCSRSHRIPLEELQTGAE